MGRRQPPRFRRVPARVVARPPTVRRDPRAPGAPGTPPDVGGRTPRLDVALPRAASQPGDGRITARYGSGAPRGASPADPRSFRRGPALRGRDRADAARPPPPQTRREPLRARRHRRGARCPRDPSGANRCSARRPSDRGARAHPGRIDPRQGIHQGWRGSALRPERGRGRASPRIARSQGAPQPPDGPALPRAWTVRVPPVARAESGARHTLQT